MDQFMNEFMEAMRDVFPQLLVQFEDFSTDNAFRYLDMFRNKYRCFNDDVRFIRFPRLLRFLNYFYHEDSRHRLASFFFSHRSSQPHGSEGSVVLSGFINAARLASSAAGTPVTDQRILFFGAGSAGVGVAKQLMSFFTLLGLSEEEARGRIYVSNQDFLFYIFWSSSRLSIPRDWLLLIGKDCRSTRNVGLIFSYLNFGIELGLDFARTDYEGPPLTSLLDIVQYVKPTALLGLSTLRVRGFLQHLPSATVSYLVHILECIYPRCCALDGLSQHPPYYLSPI